LSSHLGETSIGGRQSSPVVFVNMPGWIIIKIEINKMRIGKRD
jgi:hypothetical protein